MRHGYGGIGAWLGRSATRRLETGTRDAKTDVWMIWLQALSAVVILALDLMLIYTWLLIVPHKIIEVAGYFLAVVMAPVAATIITWIATLLWGAGCTFALKVLDPFARDRAGFCALAFIVTAVAILGVVAWDSAEWHWWRGVAQQEFPGRTWPLLSYILYGGVCLSIWIGLATAWLRWWAREIPDPVRPEPGEGSDPDSQGSMNIPAMKRQWLNELKFMGQQGRESARAMQRALLEQRTMNEELMDRIADLEAQSHIRRGQTNRLEGVFGGDEREETGAAPAPNDD